MRHKKAFNHLKRKSAHRKAMLSNMASSLIMHKRINTTVAKAKALKPYIEPLISKAKKDNTHNRRVVFRYLQDKEAVSELFRNVVVKVGERPGGYTRILKTEYRLGDNAEMCIIELVDYNENFLAAKEESETKKKRTRRGRRGSGKKSKNQDNTAQKKDENTNEADVADNEVKEVDKEEKEPDKKDIAKAEENTQTKEVKEEKKEEKPEEKAETKAEKKQEPKDENKDKAADKDENKDDKDK